MASTSLEVQNNFQLLGQDIWLNMSQTAGCFLPLRIAASVITKFSRRWNLLKCPDLWNDYCYDFGKTEPIQWHWLAVIPRCSSRNLAWSNGMIPGQLERAIVEGANRRHMAWRWGFDPLRRDFLFFLVFWFKKPYLTFCTEFNWFALEWENSKTNTSQYSMYLSR